MSTTRVSARYQIVIPKDIRDALGIKPGQVFQVFAEDKTIYLVPDVPISAMRGIAEGADATNIREMKDRV